MPKSSAKKKGSRKGMTVAERLERLEVVVGETKADGSKTRADVAGIKAQVGEMRSWMMKWIEEDRGRIRDVEDEQGEQGKTISKMQGWLKVVGIIAMVALGAWLNSIFGS